MKKTVDVTRAWRDADYFDSLSAAEKASLPQNPAGAVEVEDDALKGVSGGCTCTCCSWSCIEYA